MFSTARWGGRVGLMLLTWLVTAPAWAGAPTDQLKGTVDQVISILQDPAMATPAKAMERRQLLRQTIFDRFDFEMMAQGAVGRKWLNFDQDQKKRFVDLFSQILENAYLGKVESYQGETVEFVKEVMQSEKYARVDSEVKARGQIFKLSYRMVFNTQNSVWRVFDVNIEGVGLVANYRSQFQQILRGKSVDELLESLKSKVDEAQQQDQKTTDQAS